ncbi:hypothetical protein ACHAXT_001808 [Thalassiosira profunda]
MNREEQSSLLQEPNGNGRVNVALSQQVHRPSEDIGSKICALARRITLRHLVYACGLCILYSKTKSRCTPPKAFATEEYEPTTSGDNATTVHRVPQIVHQSYKSLAALPKEWADTPPRWQELHPEYEYKFWSDEDNRNLIKEHYHWFLETYDAYPAPIQRADAARYFAVLHYGGIYADMDILPIRHVDPLLQKLDLEENADKEMIVAETYNLGLTNALFASVPNSTVLHQFVKELPEHTKPLYGFELFVPHFAVLLSTGPTRLWIYLNQHRAKILTLNPAGWGQCHQCKQKQCVPVEGSFFETRKGGSWHKWDTRIMNFVFCHVHFCVWGGICALLWLWYKCLARRMGIGNAEANEDQGEVQDVTGKNRKFNAANALGSLEGTTFMAKRILSRHRFLLFCAVILLLVL